MSLLDFLLPEQAQATHLRQIAHTMKAGSAAKARASRATGELQDDINTVALVCMGIVAALVEKGIITEDDLQTQLGRIDGLDAIDDNGLDPDVLRGALGLKKPTPAAKASRRKPAKRPAASAAGKAPKLPRKR